MALIVRHPEKQAGDTSTYGGRASNPMRVNLDNVLYYIPSDMGITFVYNENTKISWNFQSKEKAQEFITSIDIIFEEHFMRRLGQFPDKEAGKGSGEKVSGILEHIEPFQKSKAGDKGSKPEPESPTSK